MHKLIALSAVLLSALCQADAALDYGGDIETTEWSVSGSVFECRFEQTLAGYGKAVFYHEAGEDVTFQLETLKNLMSYSQARVSILPPPWQPSARSEDLGVARIIKDTPNLRLDATRTNQFLHALLEGKWPAISHKTYYDQNRFVKVHLSAVSFPQFYQDYLDCVRQLLPVNYRQVARSKVLFASGEEQIDAADIKILDRIIFYIKNDPRIFAVYLDGHSDSVGRRYDNRQTSKVRVEDVERYFIKQGIDPEIVTTRFHGDRYPVASNKTAAGRAENRRVTIRIEQREDMPIPDNLLFKPKTRTQTTASGD